MFAPSEPCAAPVALNSPVAITPRTGAAVEILQFVPEHESGLSAASAAVANNNPNRIKILFIASFPFKPDQGCLELQAILDKHGFQGLLDH